MFLTHLVVFEAALAENWVLVEALEYTGKADTFTVPPGFYTDFASVPRALWSLVAPYGRHTKAAVLHDYLYAERPMVTIAHDEFGQPLLSPITRLDADGIFRRCLREAGVGRVKRYAMYWAVRLFGGGVWRKARA